MNYADFIHRKSQVGCEHGFAPTFMPATLFPFQRALVEWATHKGRSAIFADCGLGKTLMQLAWARNVCDHTGGRVLILAPLAVGAQTVREGQKFGIECSHVRDGDISGKAAIVVTNYEKLHLFKATDYAGIVCDESSILKHFSGATQKDVTRFSCKLPYRLLCTATAAPNDYVELGCSSEAIGELGMVDMLGRFFTQKEQPHAQQRMVGKQGRGIMVSGTGNEWRIRPHAETHFWRWVASWARACRMPSDLGFDDASFRLPELIERHHVVEAKRPKDGWLFTVDAFGLAEERDERKRTVEERCAAVARLVDDGRPAAVWCHYNYEGELLAKLIPGAVEVSGATSDEDKEAAYNGFADGSIRVLVTKPKIGAWGLNWQHCNHVVTFASHSYEQYYQSVRRCWRFGQARPVMVDVISTTGEVHVRDSMERKAAAADLMFAQLVQHMNNALHIQRERVSREEVEVPAWIK